MGASISESEVVLNYNSSKVKGYGLTGTTRTMMANRISYWLGTNGPSYGVDGACSAGAVALDLAYRSITNGYCDAAIVGAANLCFFPQISLQFRWMDLITLDEKTKCFDETADGYVRSDSVVVMFLQKSRDAKRVYAQLVHAKTVFTGIDEVNHNFRLHSGETLGRFLGQFYDEVNVRPEDVEYVEACGTGVNKADRDELEQIDKIFCSKKRENPLLVGCVKSNMGHCEPASVLAALVKACLAYHKGKIAGNLHLESPRIDVSAVRDGRIRLLNDHAAFKRGYIAVNNYTYVGLTAHFLLKNYELPQIKQRYTDLPYLICLSGRVEESMNKIFEDLESKPLDPQQIGLLQHLYKNDVPGFVMRGYSLLTMKDDKTTCLSQSSQFFDGTRRPVWFVYSGMGSQWPTMGLHFMKFPVFAASIQRCHNMLEQFGFNLTKLITDPEPSIFDNIMHSFVGISAMQIALTNLLKSIGITADNFIGHSMGELGCAYADGCLNADEMILASYYRGLASVETPLIQGSMAAIGLGYSVVKSLCPPEIEVACHNGQFSCTVSGPSDIMKVFVAELSARGIFAKEVACSSIAYHSKYIAAAGPALKKHMLKVIKEPKLRSGKWISSSVPQARWDEPDAKYCSVDYLTNNLLNPVLFEEASRLIPDNAITIEIAPHGHMQAILKRSLSKNCTHLAVAYRKHTDNAQHFLDTIGKLYVAGLSPEIQKLYPEVAFPVPAWTPMISHTLQWNHSESWPMISYKPTVKPNTGERYFVLSTYDQEHSFLKGYIVNGVNMFPPAAQLVLVWETLAMTLGVKYTDLNVWFQDVSFEVDLPIPKESALELTVMLQVASGNFEVVMEDMAIARGNITVQKEFYYNFLDNCETDDITMSKEEIYRIFSLRGYDFHKSFRSIEKANSMFTKAFISKYNWVTFIDGLIQLAQLADNSDCIAHPRQLLSLKIDQTQHNAIVENPNGNGLEATYYKHHQAIRCAGVEIKGLMTEYQTANTNSVHMNSYTFVPFISKEDFDELTALSVHMQTVIDNVDRKLHILEIKDNDYNISGQIEAILNNLPPRNRDLEVIYTKIVSNFDEIFEKISDVNFIVVSNLLQRLDVFGNVISHLNDGCFILTTDNIVPKKLKLELVSDIPTASGHQMLLRNVSKLTNFKVIMSSDSSQLRIERPRNDNLFVVAKKLQELEKIQRMALENRAKCLLIDDMEAPSFDPKSPIYKDQMKKCLNMNIYKNGVWGDYKYMTVEVSNQRGNVTLKARSPGDLDSLTWHEVPPLERSNKILVQVHYARISCGDIMRVQDRNLQMSEFSESDKDFGMSFAGVTANGDEVMGLVRGGALSSVVEADSDLLWRVPEYWTLKEAATVPQAYVQALYYLTQRSCISKDKTVLVTSGAGALGQAVINICLGVGCQVFTTVGDSRKKQTLLRLFPQLSEQTVCNSRDASAMQMVMAGTDGRGCDIIISSANGDERLVAMKCAGPRSRFIDIGVEDIGDNEKFGMSFIWKERTYLAANFCNIFNPLDGNLRKDLQKIVSGGIREGWVKPLTHVTYKPQDVCRGFKLIASRRNHGVVLVRLNEITPELTNLLPAWRSSKNDVHLILMDQLGVGLQVADRLVQLGAQNLILQTFDINSGFPQYKLRIWRSKGLNVKVISADLTAETKCNDVLTEATEMGSQLNVFVVRSGDKSDSEDETLRTLDRVTRNNKIGQFVIVTEMNTESWDAVAMETCEKRTNLGLRAKIIACLQLNMSNEREALVSFNEVLKRLDLLLATENTIMVAYEKNNEHSDRLIDTVVGTLDLRDKKLAEEMMLSDVSVDLSLAKALSNLIKSKHNIYYGPGKLLKMTSKELQDLTRNASRDISADGFAMFFTKFDGNDYETSEPLMWLPTVVSEGYNRMESYNEEPYLIVLPGMEGHRHVMMALCRRLKIRALVCQFAVQEADSLEELARQLSKAIQERIGLGEEFYILGYSYGALLAIELAATFEKKGLSGTLFCLDASPLSMRTLLNTQQFAVEEDELESKFLAHMTKLMVNEDIQGLQGKSWQEKVESVLKQIRGKVTVPIEFQRVLLDLCWRRWRQTKTYKPSLKIRSDLVLLRGRNDLDLPNDYGLGDVTTGGVRVYGLEEGHVNAPYDLRCADIINQELKVTE